VLLQPLLSGNPGIRFAGKLPRPEFPQRRLSFLLVLLQPFCERLLLLLLHRCRVVDDPLLRDTGILGRMLRIPVPVVRTWQQDEVCGNELFHLVQGRRHPADPERMSAERREVLGRIKRSIGDVVDLARVLQVLGQLSDDRQQRLLIRLIPGEGLQEERDAVLIGRHSEDELLEVPLAILGMAVGDGHIAGVEVGVVLATDAVESPLDKTETVEYHGFDNIPMSEVVVTGFGDGTVDGPGDLEGVESTGDDPEIADRDVGVFDEVNRSGHIRGYLLKVQGSCGLIILPRAQVSAKGGVFITENR